MLIDLLIAINILIPIFCSIVLCYNNKGIKLDHVFIVSAAYLYFWMIPLTAYRYKIFNYIIQEGNFAHMFNLNNIILGESDKIKYLICIICIYLSFIIGEIISRNMRYRKYRIKYLSVTYRIVVLTKIDPILFNLAVDVNLFCWVSEVKNTFKF